MQKDSIRIWITISLRAADDDSIENSYTPPREE